MKVAIVLFGSLISMAVPKANAMSTFVEGKEARGLIESLLNNGFTSPDFDGDKHLEKYVLKTAGFRCEHTHRSPTDLRSGLQCAKDGRALPQAGLLINALSQATVLPSDGGSGYVYYQVRSVECWIERGDSDRYGCWVDVE